MAHQEHPVFAAPPDVNAPVLRYVDFAKFVSLLDRRALFLSRADRLGDRFEGSVTARNLQLRPQVYGPEYKDILPQIIAGRRQALMYTFVNCWTLAPDESVAMWRLYVGDSPGVAVESTFSRLGSSLRGDQAVHVGLVKYVDWSTHWISEENMFEPFVHKRMGFAYEREVRLATLKVSTRADDPSQADFGAPGPPGIYVPVDLDELVVAIRLPPESASWLVDLTRSVMDRYGLDRPVRQSDLDGEPLY